MTRKASIIARITIKRGKRGMTTDEVLESTKGYYKKTIDELELILEDERKV